MNKNYQKFIQRRRKYALSRDLKFDTSACKDSPDMTPQDFAKKGVIMPVTRSLKCV